MMYKDSENVYLLHRRTSLSILGCGSWGKFLPHAQRSHAYPICGNITMNRKDMLVTAFRLVYSKKHMHISSVMNIRAGHLDQGKAEVHLLLSI